MIYKNLELHNVSEIYEANGGIAFYRTEKSLGEKLSDNGRNAIARTGGVEIRFVTDSEVYITLSTLDDTAKSHLTVFYGNIPAGMAYHPLIIDSTPRKIRFRKSPDFDFLSKTAKLYNHPFSPQVIRIISDGTPIVIHSAQGDARPPKKDEVPDKTILFYGSSITFGTAISTGDLHWPFLTAEKLGIDHIGLGFPASALYEHSIADHIAKRQDFDALFLEIGVNFYADSSESIRERVEYMLKTVRKAHPDKYIFCTDIFYAHPVPDIAEGMINNVRRVVSETVPAFQDEKIIYIPGLKLMGEPRFLSEDHIHPSVAGHIEIANNLSAALKPYIDKI